jgi:hypothetical protein
MFGRLMKRVALTGMFLAALALPAAASSGFGCEAEDKNVAKLVVEGATPRSGGVLINFGAEVEIEAGKLLVFKQKEVKNFVWNARGLKVRVVTRVNNENAEVTVDAKPDKNDEDVWRGSYKVSAGKLVKSGKVKCFVE